MSATAHWIQDLQISFRQTHNFFTYIWIYMLNSRSENLMSELLICFQMVLGRCFITVCILLPIVIASKSRSNESLSKRAMLCIYIYIVKTLKFFKVRTYTHKCEFELQVYVDMSVRLEWIQNQQFVYIYIYTKRHVW